MRRGAGPALIVAGALMVFGGGCAGTTEGRPAAFRAGAAADLLPQVARNTLAAGSAYAEVRYRSAFATGATFVGRVNGTYDWSGGVSELILHVPSIEGADGETIPNEPGSENSLVKVVVAGGAAFLWSDHMDSLGVDPDQWLRLDGTESAFLLTPDYRLFLDLLSGVGSGVTVEGAERIGGIPTTHYRVLDTISGLQARITDPARARLGAFFQRYESVLDRPLTLDVFVDDQGRLRQEVASLDIDDGVTETLALELDLSALGQPVSIRVPSGSEIGAAKPMTIDEALTKLDE